MESLAATGSRRPGRYGWASALGALLAGSIIALLPLILLALAQSPLHLLPGSIGAQPGSGWPWRIDGAWAALADLGPLLAVSTLVAGGVGLYVGSRTGARTARWPLALCATLVGWIPLAQGGRAGLLGVSGGLAFLAMWWTTHKTAGMPRPCVPGSRVLAVALGAVLAVGLAVASLTYGALHPVRATVGSGLTVTLRAGAAERFALDLANEGPLPARILGFSLPDAHGLRLTRVERELGISGPTPDSLFGPAGRPRITAGGSLTLWLTLTGSVGCAGSEETLAVIDVRLALAGANRTQRVPLADPLRVACRG